MDCKYYKYVKGFISFKTHQVESKIIMNGPTSVISKCEAWNVTGAMILLQL